MNILYVTYLLQKKREIIFLGKPGQSGGIFKPYVYEPDQAGPLLFEKGKELLGSLFRITDSKNFHIKPLSLYLIYIIQIRHQEDSHPPSSPSTMGQADFLKKFWWWD
jgi:hypothetical protein